VYLQCTKTKHTIQLAEFLMPKIKDRLLAEIIFITVWLAKMFLNGTRLANS